MLRTHDLKKISVTTKSITVIESGLLRGYFKYELQFIQVELTVALKALCFAAFSKLLIEGEEKDCQLFPTPAFA